MDTKIIFITGGVLSSLGKGILASSVAQLLKEHTGKRIALMKIDPYLNTDAGTLNPFEHGECFVTRDGHEGDLDLGNYERFLNQFTVREQNVMMGSVYNSIVHRERHGDYLGKTVQLIPHVTDEVKNRIRECIAKTGCEVLVIEIGGTVGDIESEVVLEAARQLKFDKPPGTVLFLHLALLPTIVNGEEKTKPMQHSVKALLARGITPDLLVGRTAVEMQDDSRKKIARQCNVRAEDVYCSPNVSTIYRVPDVLERQKMHESIITKLAIPQIPKTEENNWHNLLNRLESATDTLDIAVVGKYATSKDAYLSVFEALTHAAANNDLKVNSDLIDSEKIEQGHVDLTKYNAFIIPGGWGGRGVNGKMAAIKHARENNIPLLGICYGFQLSIIEIARNELNLTGANSTEIDKATPHPVIDILPEQVQVKDMGGTTRLGVKRTVVLPGTLMEKMYGANEIEKRFRHRFEMNPTYVEQLQTQVRFSAMDETNTIMKALEIPSHKFFVGVQYHPEFDSRLENPEPLFYNLVKAAK